MALHPPSATESGGPTALRQSSLRERNLSAVLAAVCRGGDHPPSRADIAGELSMTRATATRLADELVDAGMVEEVPRTIRAPGRPARPLVPGERFSALGLLADTDVLVARIVDLRGRVTAERTSPRPDADPAAALAALAGLAHTVVAEADPPRLVGAGLAVPGIVDDHGVLVRAPRLDWADLDIVAEYRNAGGTSLDVVGNDADMAAVTEARPTPGSPGQWSDFLHVQARFGVGGAVVSGSRVMVGKHGGAGEFGHVCVDPHGPACACGSTGCLEQYVGLDAVSVMAGLDPSEVATQLGPLALAGDPRCGRALETVTWALSVALASVVNVVGVSHVVLGGYLAGLEPQLHARLQDRLHARVLGSRRRPVVVRPGSADRGAAASGAALLVLEQIVSAPARWL